MAHESNLVYDYLGNGLRTEQVAKVVKASVALLKRVEFDGIAFRGMSGALIAPIVAYELGKPLLMVRKPRYVDFAGEKGNVTEDRHACYNIEGDLGVKTYVIIDDFVSTGDTIRAIINQIYEKAPEARCIGILEFNYVCDDRYRPGAGRELRPVDKSILGEGYKVKCGVPADEYLATIPPVTTHQNGGPVSDQQKNAAAQPGKAASNASAPKHKPVSYERKIKRMSDRQLLAEVNRQTKFETMGRRYEGIALGTVLALLLESHAKGAPTLG